MKLLSLPKKNKCNEMRSGVANDKTEGIAPWVLSGPCTSHGCGQVSAPTLGVVRSRDTDSSKAANAWDSSNSQPWSLRAEDAGRGSGKSRTSKEGVQIVSAGKEGTSHQKEYRSYRGCVLEVRQQL